MYDAFSDDYDRFVNWPNRLAFELPFLEQRLQASGARRVLDAACGTGRHAVLFHQWGLEVEGADVSPAMIDRCRRAHGEPPGLRWVERSFTQPADPPGRFDAVVCVGNSLALADSLPSAARARRASCSGTTTSPGPSRRTVAAFTRAGRGTSCAGRGLVRPR